MSSGNPQEPNFDDLGTGDPFADIPPLDAAGSPAADASAAAPTELPAGEPHEAAAAAEDAAAGGQVPAIDDAALAGLPEDFLAVGGAAPPADEPSIEPAKDEQDEKPSKPGVLKRLAEANPYTVILGLALLAVTVACLFLFIELWHYGFDISAKSAKQHALATPAAAVTAVETAATV